MLQIPAGRKALLTYDGGTYVVRTEKSRLDERGVLEYAFTVLDVVRPSGTVCELECGESHELSRNTNTPPHEHCWVMAEVPENTPTDEA